MTARGAELANEASHRRVVEQQLRKLTADRHEMRLLRPIIQQGDTWVYCICGDVVAVPWFDRDDPETSLPLRATAAYRAHLKDTDAT